MLSSVLILVPLLLPAFPDSKPPKEPAVEEVGKRLAPFFRPPAELVNDLGKYRSPLLFDDGAPIRNAADWQKRRQEILKYWHGVLGPWPALIEKPKIDYLK